MDETRLSEALSKTGIGEYRYFKSIGSTNDEALSWVDAGAGDFCLVLADTQTRGRGRSNRRWVTVPEASLAFSLIIKPTVTEARYIPLFAPLCGLAVRTALLNLFSLQSAIKWPNDVLLDKKKCCGILVESVWNGDQLGGIVAGIGINITSSSIPPADDQRYPATSLESELNQKIDRLQVLTEVINNMREWRTKLGTPQFFDTWQSNLAFKGEQVMIVQSEKQSIIGIEKGIDQKGNLILTLENNEEMTFEVGDVHLRPLDLSSKPGGKHA
jgi:BirA family transcriptional regulator, biotin operon repressor / biotin---[acetyl-CoA-carboxylase] ligase